MAAHCRHIMPGGDQCHGYALQGEDLCYFHNRRRLADQKPVNPMGSIEIPLLEDRCVIQVTITQILRAVINKSLDRARASTLLYGLQLALQSVDRRDRAIPYSTVKDFSETSDGEELASDPDEDEDEDEEADEDDEDSDDDSESDDDEDSDEDSDDDSGDDDSSDSDDDPGDDEEAEDDDSEDADSDDDDDDDPDDETPYEDQTDAELVADAKYLQSISNALDKGDMRAVARLLKE